MAGGVFNEELAEAIDSVSASTKVCPECAETIKAAANVCRHCGHRFVTDEDGPQ